jgi:hypothetical protein
MSCLLKLLHRWRNEAGQAGRQIKRIVVANEAGREGFWLARWLRVRGVGAYIIPRASQCPRRARVHRRDHLWRLASSVSVFIIEGRQEFCDGARLALGRRPIDLSGSLAMITTGVGFYDARINCEALALDETCIHARSDHRLEGALLQAVRT